MAIKIYKFDTPVTGQIIGANGIVGDSFKQLIIVPMANAPGPVTIHDGDPTGGPGTYIDYLLYAGTPTGATSLNDLRPIVLDFDGIASVKGGWYITTGDDVEVLIFGNVSD